MPPQLVPFDHVCGYIALSFLFLLAAWLIERGQTAPATRLIFWGIVSAVVACGYGLLGEPQLVGFASTLSKIGFVLVLAGASCACWKRGLSSILRARSIMSERIRWLAVLVVAVGAYFVAFPEDADAVARPIGAILGLSSAISPWLYGLIAVAIMAKVVVKIWASRAAT